MKITIGVLLLALGILGLSGCGEMSATADNTNQLVLTGCLVTHEVYFVLINITDSSGFPAEREYRLVPDEQVDLIPHVASKVQVWGALEEQRREAQGETIPATIKVTQLKPLEPRCP